MTETSKDSASEPKGASAFENEAEQPEMGLLAEFWDFVKYNKKWWLTPIIIIILLMTGVILLGPAAPFIYPMF